MADPADRVTLDESVTMAFLVMLESITPAERVAFILHDVFGYSFAEVARIVGRTPAACRQLASSARRIRASQRLARSPPPACADRRSRPPSLVPSTVHAVCRHHQVSLDLEFVGRPTAADHGARACRARGPGSAAQAHRAQRDQPS
jgi:Sigma-70, region 4